MRPTLYWRPCGMRKLIIVQKVSIRRSDVPVPLVQEIPCIVQMTIPNFFSANHLLGG